jgi:hypothetical protein
VIGYSFIQKMIQKLQSHGWAVGNAENFLESVQEIELGKTYRFMYENFIIATQHDLYLVLEKTDLVNVIKFSGAQFKYGGPNDEARQNHELFKKGLGLYGMYRVDNSIWALEHSKKCTLGEIKNFTLPVHYVVCFKDVMLEVLCRRGFEELDMTVEQVNALVLEQLSMLEE